MSKQLIVERDITIDSPAADVWDILTLPVFIRGWDDLPEDFGDTPLQRGTEIKWIQKDKSVILTVTDFEPHKRLKLNLYNSDWENPAEAYDIAYTYTLQETGGQTELHVTIGDFQVLSKGQDYFDSAEEFGDNATQKIKELAEN